MPITPDLTIRETAALSGVSRTVIEKAVEAHVLEPLAAPARFRGGATRFLPIRAVAYFHALQRARLNDLPLRHKRSIWGAWLALNPCSSSPSNSLPALFSILNDWQQARLTPRSDTGNRVIDVLHRMRTFSAVHRR